MATLDLLLREYGTLGLLLILFLDGSGIPWPTEATLVMAGVAIRTQHLHPLLAYGAAVLGGVGGSMVSYSLGRLLGRRFLERIFSVTRLPKNLIAQGESWFLTHGERAVFFARFIPFVRVFIGYPAGVMGTPFPRYVLFSAAGYACYIALGMGLGYAGLSFAQIIGDAGLVIWIFGIIGLIYAWFKWGRPLARRMRGKG